MYVTQLLTGLKDIFCTCEVHNVFLYIALKFIPIYSRLNEAPGPSTSRVSDSISDIVKAAIENSDVGLKKKQVEFEKSWNSEKEPEPEIIADNISASNVRPKEPAGSAMFLPSSSSTSGRPVLILKLTISLCSGCEFNL